MNKAVEIKDDLIKEAMRITGAASEREAIEKVVETYVAQHRRTSVSPKKSMFDLVGVLRVRPDHDYKAMRGRDAAD
jgi:Arc/MetJ family transcription regulator